MTASARPFSTAHAAFTRPVQRQARASSLPRGALLLPASVPAEEVHRVPSRLELGRQHLVGLQRGNGKGDQRGRHVQIHEGAGHGVLAADGGGAQLQLGVQRAQQGGEGLAPAVRARCRSFSKNSWKVR